MRKLFASAILVSFLCLDTLGEVQPQTLVAPVPGLSAPTPSSVSAAPVSTSSTNHQAETGTNASHLSSKPYPFKSGNLRPVTPGPDEAERLQLYQTQLDLGRNLRQSSDWDNAQECLSRLMAMPAPIEFHRAALLELGYLAQDRRQFVRAQQIYSQYLQRFREDPSVPEVLLRQGLLYRDMGAPTLALSKFYAVMSSALNLKLDRLAYYQRLVLQAQTEIADTYYLDGKYDDAADYFRRLLKLDNPDLNREQIQYKLVRCCAGAKRLADTLTQAQLFAELFPASAHLAEVRFLQADALKQLGRKDEALRVVIALMEQQRKTAATQSSADQRSDPPAAEGWAYWQHRTGNELANQLYEEGDLLNALEIYRRLGELNSSLAWRLPAWYQAGLIYERLKQPQKATEVYARILEESKKLAPDYLTATLSTVLEMARWRQEHLAWQANAEQASQQLTRSVAQ